MRMIVAICGSYALLPAASVYGGVLLFVQRRANRMEMSEMQKSISPSAGNGFAMGLGPDAEAAGYSEEPTATEAHLPWREG